MYPKVSGTVADDGVFPLGEMDPLPAHGDLKGFLSRYLIIFTDQIDLQSQQLCKCIPYSILFS